MGKKKTQTTQNQQYANSYGYMNTPITPQMQGVINMANGPAQTDPSIQNRFASMEEDARRSYDDPFGPGTSPDVRAKAQRSRLLGIQTARDKSMREGYFDAQNQQFGRKVTAAGLTAPQLVQMGGNSSGIANTTQSGGLFGQIIGPAIQGAATIAA